jgi:hypothetical protein
VAEAIPGVGPPLMRYTEVMPDTALGLPHELLILSLDEAGIERANWGGGVQAGMAGALLLELLETGHLAEDGRHLVAAPPSPERPEPTGLLGEALAVVRNFPKPRDAKGWVQRLPRELKPIHHRVAHELVERGVVDERRRDVLGISLRTRYPEVDPEPERRLRERLRAVLLEGATPSTHEALLISLLQPYDMVKGLVERPERKAATKRAKEVAEQTPVTGAVGATVRDAQAAVMAAVIAASVVSTTTAANS